MRVVVLAAAAAGCGDERGVVQPSMLGPSTQVATAASTAIDSRCDAPSAPDSPRATVNGTTVSFTWAAVPDAREYVVAVGTTPGGSQTLFTDTTATTYDWSAAVGSYYARVHAHSGCGTSDPSSELTFTVEGF